MCAGGNTLSKSDLLNNRYKLVDHIGTGGMAEVYRAHDTLLDREVAVKILHKQFVSDETFIAKFKREAKAAAKLSHPCIVNVFDVGHSEDINFIVMEYVAGGTLKQEIEKYGRLSYKDAIKIAIDVASALNHAHIRGLVHCDIKPHNILIDSEGKAKVADFGIARVMATATATLNNNDVMGSVHYVSPEQAAGKSVTAQSDIYSLGIVLFEMLTGRVPFEAETPVAVALRHVKDNPPLLREFNPDIPPVLESIVSKTLAKNPSDRYRTANELINELKRAEILVKDLIENDPLDSTIFISNYANNADEQTILIDKDKINNLKKKKYSKAFYVAVVLGLLVLGFFVGIFGVYGNFWSSKEVKVPNVVGKQQAIAEQLIREANLYTKIEEEENSKFGPGEVIRQKPEAGETVKEGRHITLVVNKGGKSVDVPDIVDLNIEQAKIRLRDAGLKLGIVKESFTDKIKEDTVIGQEPIAKSKVERNSTVDIIIAKKQVAKVKTPDLSGLSVEKAKKVLEAAKLSVGNISERAASESFGSVVSQSPSANEEVLVGSKVDIVIAKAGTVTRKNNIVEFVVPSSDGLHNVRIDVIRNGSRERVYENTHKAGERIRLTIENSGSGDVRVEFYVNGALLEEKRV